MVFCLRVWAPVWAESLSEASPVENRSLVHHPNSPWDTRNAWNVWRQQNKANCSLDDNLVTELSEQQTKKLLRHTPSRSHAALRKACGRGWTLAGDAEGAHACRLTECRTNPPLVFSQMPEKINVSAAHILPGKGVFTGLSRFICARAGRATRAWDMMSLISAGRTKTRVWV